MDAQYDSIGESGLRFFGTMSASISHELKNVLAIINENAGLLEDLTLAAERGGSIDPERINRACRNFFKQIHRADDILKNMNMFAHSVDQFRATVAVHELARLVADLAGRLAAMRKLTITVITPTEPVVITTNPFLLENLIWLCLEYAIAATTGGGSLEIRVEHGTAGALLHLSGLTAQENATAAPLSAALEHILSALGARLEVQPASGAMVIYLT